MKKIIFPIIAALAAMSLFSCSRKVDFTTLSFVYFENGSKTVYEDAGEIEIPVFASADVDFTVTFTSIDGVKTDSNTGLEVPNGQKGVDYSIIDNDAEILRYSGGAQRQVIKVSIVDFPGVLTGNKEFTLKLQSAGNEVALGGVSTCKVTIIDNDHPLKEIFGEYTATDKDGASWTMTFAEDPNSYTQVLLDGIVPAVAGDWVTKGVRHYIEAPVTADLSKVSVPLGYTFPDAMNDNDVMVYGYDGTYIHPSGSLAFEKTEDGYKLDGDKGFVALYESGGSYYLAASNGIALAPITLVKKQ
ncbi:MAG: hypothetical protein IJU21_07220 [Bacteroidales bacterium]|nr:hypothetical protein [Bacteroidales bacterium]